MNASLALLVSGWLAVSAVGAPALAVEPTRVRLLSPTAGSELAAGNRLEFAWELITAAPPGATEWELFLSLDGGRTHPVRLTPHLDLSRRRVVVRLPDVPTAEARFLLRVGDERNEFPVEVGGNFRIVHGAHPAPADVGFQGLGWRVPPRGESALPGGLGVVQWVEGRRDGSGWREVRAPALPVAVPVVHPGSLHLAGSIPPRRPEATALVDPQLGVDAPLVPARLAGKPATPARSRPVLLLLQRSNR